MSNYKIKNLKAAERLSLIPKELAYGLGALSLLLGILCVYFWYKSKERRKIYIHVFNGNLKAKSISEKVNEVPKYSFLNAKKILNKYPLPTFRIRYMHLIYLYSSVVLFIIGLTLLAGKPLGIM